MAYTKAKILLELAAQEARTGENSDTRLVREALNCASLGSHINALFKVTFYRYGSKSYEVAREYAPSDLLRKLIKIEAEL